MKPIDSTLTISGPISGTSAMMPSSQAKALVMRPTTTTLPAMTAVLTRCSLAHQTSRTIASHSGTITFQFFHQATGSVTRRLGECALQPFRGRQQPGVVAQPANELHADGQSVRAHAAGDIDGRR